MNPLEKMKTRQVIEGMVIYGASNLHFEIHVFDYLIDIACQLGSENPHTSYSTWAPEQTMYTETRFDEIKENFLRGDWVLLQSSAISSANGDVGKDFFPSLADGIKKSEKDSFVNFTL